MKIDFVSFLTEKETTRKNRVPRIKTFLTFLNNNLSKQVNIRQYQIKWNFLLSDQFIQLFAPRLLHYFDNIIAIFYKKNFTIKWCHKLI